MGIIVCLLVPLATLAGAAVCVAFLLYAVVKIIVMAFDELRAFFGEPARPAAATQAGAAAPTGAAGRKEPWSTPRVEAGAKAGATAPAGLPARKPPTAPRNITALITYVNAARNIGRSIDDIDARLKAKGWQDRDINVAFGLAGVRR